MGTGRWYTVRAKKKQTSVLFCDFTDRDKVQVHKNEKNNKANIQPSWPNKLGQ